jgi:hypothetical protein
MLFYVLLILILIIGFVVAYQSELESQDCTEYCSHWVHDNKSRWRHNITLTPEQTIQERVGLFYSAVEWRRALIVTIVITVPLALVYYYFCCKDSTNVLRLYVLSFFYVFIIVFFISMYYQDLWHKAMRH